MLFTSVTKHTELCGPFFKLLTLLTESSGGPSGLPCFSQLILHRVWDAAEYCPQSSLDWLAVQAPRNKIAHDWILQSSDSWVEQFLLAHNNPRVRNAAAYLLVSLVPSQSFRANYRATSLKLPIQTAQRELSGDALMVLHTILNLLLRLIRPARSYTEISLHGTGKLTAYFSLMTYCMVSRTEKVMVRTIQLMLICACKYVIRKCLACSSVHLCAHCGNYFIQDYPSPAYQPITTNNHFSLSGIIALTTVPKMPK